jgi:hypothetical protein
MIKLKAPTSEEEALVLEKALAFAQEENKKV